MKTKKSILTICLIGLTAGLAAISMTGCETAQRAHEAYNDFEESNPLLANALESGARALLYAQLDGVTSDPLKQQLLTQVIDAAFIAADTPQGVASGLQTGIAGVYPDDPVLQALVVDEFVQALNAPSTSTVPASSAGDPSAQFTRDLAAALKPGVSYDYSCGPVYAVAVSAVREI